MATKKEQNAQNDKQAKEIWRKPLQVPPRSNAMRSFYQGGEDTAAEQEADQTPTSKNSTEEEETSPEKVEKTKPKSSPKQATNVKTEAVKKAQPKILSKTTAKGGNKLTEETLASLVGFEIEDLFDIHELLRGKSFDIYRTLVQSSDEKGRCKITQPELMRRTGIKNRRTFYKHEEWLINLKLLEKRHLPGDHKGVVYRVFDLKEALPLTDEKQKQFSQELET